MSAPSESSSAGVAALLGVFFFVFFALGFGELGDDGVRRRAFIATAASSARGSGRGCSPRSEFHRPSEADPAE